MNKPIAIHTVNLTKFYGSFPAIKQLNLKVYEGEIFGFLGSNGAGKTTTIRLLMDFIRPTTGKAVILGFDSRQESLDIRKNIGFIPSETFLYPKMTGIQFLKYMANLKKGVDWKFVAELIERLQCDVSRSIQALSRGNRQKISLIQAFMKKPKLIIMDEPTNALDPLIQQEFHSIVEEVKQDGRTVFMSSHNMTEVEKVCDRVGIIREGNLMAVESVKTLKARSLHKFEIHFSSLVKINVFSSIEGITELQLRENILRCTIRGRPDALIKAASKYDINKLVTWEPRLEEIFLSYYGENDHHDS